MFCRVALASSLFYVYLKTRFNFIIHEEFSLWEELVNQRV